MPNMLFTRYERHTTFAALSRCPQEYAHLVAIREGRALDRPASLPALIGIGADHIVTSYWRATLAGENWAPTMACGYAILEVSKEAGHLQEADRAILHAELGLFAPQYYDQWKDARSHWRPLALHPYLDPKTHPMLLFGDDYLTMPDAVMDIGDGAITVVDVKTSARPYDWRRYAYDLQLLANCLPYADGPKPVQFLIDFAQRPKKTVREWTFPPAQPFPFDAPRRAIAERWLARCRAMKTVYAAMDEWAQIPIDGCQRWYGRCEFWEQCFGDAAVVGGHADDGAA